jgi:hypothetical protein
LSTQYKERILRLNIPAMQTVKYSMLLVSLGCPFAVCIAGMLRRNIRNVL